MTLIYTYQKYHHPLFIIHLLTLWIDWPQYLAGSQVAELLQAYATKFQLHQYIQFNTTIRVILRDDADAGWNVHVAKENDKDEVLHFDKVVLGTGSDTLPVWPQMPGRDKFMGTVMHGQNYKL